MFEVEAVAVVVVVGCASMMVMSEGPSMMREQGLRRGVCVPEEDDREEVGGAEAVASETEGEEWVYTKYTHRI